MERFHWQIATVIAIKQETPGVKTLTLRLEEWIPHVPGQHYDIRLTAEDGYQAQRSYSVASPPGQTGEIDLTIELIKDGEVSGYLFERMMTGDPLEVRGPIGGYFIWKDEMANTPLLLVAGGSGVVPLMAMIRHRTALGATNRTTLLFSVRQTGGVIYHDELSRLAKTDPTFALVITYTREAPPGWTGLNRRIDRMVLRDALSSLPGRPECFVCGPTPMVEQVANMLLDLGLPAENIRTERFGPTGITEK